jgi:putative transposase
LKALPRGAFEQAVRDHAGDRHAKGFTCWSQLVAMVYAQLSGAASLRQLEAGFNQHVRHHYHLGTGAIRRSTLADANAKRDPQVFADTLRLLIEQAGRTVRKQREELLYLLDATSIALSGASRQAFGSHPSAQGNHGVKLHLLLQANSQTVAQCSITSANVNDVQEGKLMRIEPGATYVFDKGYCDYNWWQSIDAQGARWVTRFKRDAALKYEQELAIEQPALILRDSVVRFAHQRPRGGKVNAYTKALRRIEVARGDKPPLVLATNDLNSSAEEIAQLYKARWGIELFFKWIKQHLMIKRFLGRSANAIGIHLLTALMAYMLVVLLKQARQFTGSLWMLLAELRAALFERPRTEQSRWKRQKKRDEFVRSVQPGLFT